MASSAATEWNGKPPLNKHGNGPFESDSGMSEGSPGPVSSLSSPETREPQSPNFHDPEKYLAISEDEAEDEDTDLHPSVIVNPSNRLKSESDDTPLDFSLKPKKPPPKMNLEDRMNIVCQSKPGTGRSAFDTVSSHPPSGLPGFPAVGLSGLPLGLNPALLAASLPIGSPLLSASFNVHGMNSALENGSNFGNSRQQQGRNSPPAKVTRPFKAYNPMEPLSALQLSNQCQGLQGLPGAPASLSTNPDIFLAQYRQYLLNAQSALLRSRTNGSSPLPSANAASVIAHALGGHKPLSSLSGSSSHGSLTPSPPQVTSTSHPHFDEVRPCSISSRLKTAKSVDLGSLRPLEKPSTISITQELKQIEAEANEEDSNSAAAIRRRGKSLPDEQKDQAYWERRRKNNEAAKRSRDTRRQKEDEIAMRAAILEQENLRLRMEVQQLKAETEKLRQVLLNS